MYEQKETTTTTTTTAVQVSLTSTTTVRVGTSTIKGLMFRTSAVTLSIANKAYGSANDDIKYK